MKIKIKTVKTKNDEVKIKIKIKIKNKKDKIIANKIKITVFQSQLQILQRPTKTPKPGRRNSKIIPIYIIYINVLEEPTTPIPEEPTTPIPEEVFTTESPTPITTSGAKEQCVIEFSASTGTFRRRT